MNALWLAPVFEAPSYHGYDFTEFYQVEKDYGSMAQFEQMVTTANAKHIRVILDLVINHISDQHDWFKRSAAGEAPDKDYFVWRDSLPTDGWGPAWDANKARRRASRCPQVCEHGLAVRPQLCANTDHLQDGQFVSLT